MFVFSFRKVHHTSVEVDRMNMSGDALHVFGPFLSAEDLSTEDLSAEDLSACLEGNGRLVKIEPPSARVCAHL